MDGTARAPIRANKRPLAATHAPLFARSIELGEPERRTATNNRNTRLRFTPSISDAKRGRLPKHSPTKTTQFDMQNVHLDTDPRTRHKINGTESDVSVRCDTHRKGTKVTELATYCGQIVHAQRDEEGLTLHVALNDGKTTYFIDQLS